MLSTGLFSLTLFVDRMLLYWFSNDAASGAMSAGSLFWTVICVPSGMLGYTSTFVSQYMGVGRLDRGFRVVVQGCFLGVCFGPFFFLLAYWIPDVFVAFGHDPSLIESETSYFRWLMPGAWATVIASAITGLFAGIGKTRILLICDAVATVINIVADTLLIFGYLGLPRMGVVGAAVASSLSLTTKALLVGWIAWRYWKSHQSEVAHRRLDCDLALMRRLVRYGWPAGMQMFAESVSFSIIMLLVGKLGTLKMAATTLALGVNIIAFVPINGLGIAVSVLVGQYLTSGKPELAERSVRSGLGIGVAYASLFAIVYGFFPDPVMDIYSWGADPERFAEMRPLLRPLLYIIAGYCILDALQIVYVSAIKGAGDTYFVFMASIVIGASVVGGGKVLGDWLEGQLYWWWGVIFVWVVLLAVIFGARYYQGSWKKMRVIEHEWLPDEPNQT
jgi:MATE family multidrug resistance protein